MDKLFYYGLRITEPGQIAEDVLQEVFQKIWLDGKSIVDVQCYNTGGS